MQKDKEYNQADELSRCLDSLNDGKQPVIQDKEIISLMEVAALVKQSSSQDDLPKYLIAEMADTLAKERKAQKQKWRKHWLYGGLVGSAAAIVIAAFGQFLLPKTPDNMIAQEINDTKEKPQMTAAADQSGAPKNAELPDKLTQRQEQTNKSAEEPVSPATEQSADSVSKVLTDIIHGSEVPETEQSNQVAILQQDALNDVKMQKSAVLTESERKSLRASKIIQPEHKMTIMMVMPNQTAESTNIDNVSGVIHQVYHLGNNDEIIITQKLLDENGAQSKADAQQDQGQGLERSAQVQPFTQEAKDNSNSITVKVDKYDIIIEGRKTTAELQKIAKSLTAKKLE